MRISRASNPEIRSCQRFLQFGKEIQSINSPLHLDQFGVTKTLFIIQ